MTADASGMAAAQRRAAETGGARIVLPGQSPEGEYILSVLVKRTYRIVPGGACTRGEVDQGLVSADMFWDHPMNSSVRHESDLVPFKVATDVVLNGTARAPGGAPAASCIVSLQVEDRRKAILVVGDRTAHYAGGGAPTVTEPVPFTEMPLRYELAYGGTDVHSDVKLPYPYPRNPLGRGFVVANTRSSVDSLPLPNLEDPEAPLGGPDLCLGEYACWETCPAPAGFGWFPKPWWPRALRAGVMPRDRAVEQELRQAYARFVPKEHREAYLTHGLRDMDFRFFNGASDGLALPYLRGGETILTENLHPAGRMAFQLPIEAPTIGLDIGFGVSEPPVVLHTVMIRLDEGDVDLVWRGAVPYPGPDWLPEMRKMDVLVA